MPLPPPLCSYLTFRGIMAGSFLTNYSSTDEVVNIMRCMFAGELLHNQVASTFKTPACQRPVTHASPPHLPSLCVAYLAMQSPRR